MPFLDWLVFCYASLGEPHPGQSFPITSKMKIIRRQQESGLLRSLECSRKKGAPKMRLFKSNRYRRLAVEP